MAASTNESRSDDAKVHRARGQRAIGEAPSVGTCLCVHTALLPAKRHQVPVLHELQRWCGQLRQLDDGQLHGNQVFVRCVASIADRSRPSLSCQSHW
jgi:hypothetical protein